MRILVCGDRDWDDEDLIGEVLNSFIPVSTTIIHGAARGADSLAGNVARKLDMEVIEFPADWKTYGRAAGPLRNQQMLFDGFPNLVIAFHDNLYRSKGTQDMVRRAKKAFIPCLLVAHNEKLRYVIAGEIEEMELEDIENFEK